MHIKKYGESEDNNSMNIKRIFPMEVNLQLRNAKNFIFQKKYCISGAEEGMTRCFFLDAATYNNLGDQAIALSMELFLDDLFGRDNVFVINETAIISYLKSLKKEIKEDDIIVMSGGGNMGDLYPRYESIRRLIIKNFPDNKIVIFPQTLDYSNDKYGLKEYAKAQIIYSRHKNLWVCVREEKSYKKMLQMCDNVLLVPDIVFYLSGKVKVECHKSNRIGVCLRNDSESTLTKRDKMIIHEMASAKGEYNELNTMIEKDTKCFTKEQRLQAVYRKINEFSNNELIITDRLHGMIFSILANVPCVAIDNKNHKVKGVYSTMSHQLKNTTVITNSQITSIGKLFGLDRECIQINVDQKYMKLREILMN